MKDFFAYFALLGFLLMTTFFICGLSSVAYKPKCEHPKVGSYVGFVAMPFRYSFWIGCEAAEQRFNLNEGK